jgi:hypothetical protein
MFPCGDEKGLRMNNRFGVFEITRYFIEEQPESVVDMFSKLKMIVVRAEMLYHKNAIEYTAMSPFFEKLEMGYVTPFYKIEVVAKEDGENEYKAVKQGL